MILKKTNENTFTITKLHAMPCYYIMIHFDGPYVSGFIVPQANDEFHALKILKKSIWARIKVCIEKGINLQSHLGDDSVPRLRSFMRSLKRPWRQAGENRRNNEKRAKDVINGKFRGRMVKIIELQLPVLSDYWLRDIIIGREYCNLPTTWEPRPR